MDNQAIKAYSSVIADAAEDSEPEHPVQYLDISETFKKPDTRRAQAPKWIKFTEKFNIFKMVNIAKILSV